MHKVSYVLTKIFCQDSSKNYFGNQHSSGAREDNPSFYDFGFNDNAIRNLKAFKPILISNVHDGLINFELDTKPVPCCKKKKKKKKKKTKQPLMP